MPPPSGMSFSPLRVYPALAGSFLSTDIRQNMERMPRRKFRCGPNKALMESFA
jgi:hypothetical protein